MVLNYVPRLTPNLTSNQRVRVRVYEAGSMERGWGGGHKGGKGGSCQKKGGERGMRVTKGGGGGGAERGMRGGGSGSGSARVRYERNTPWVPLPLHTPSSGLLFATDLAISVRLASVSVGLA